jgi:hypothetical protein
MDVPEGMDELDEDVRFCGPCAIAEIERLKDEGIAVLDTIERLMDAGYYFGKQDGKRWLWNADGEGVAYGETFRELCDCLDGAVVDSSHIDLDPACKSGK